MQSGGHSSGQQIWLFLPPWWCFIFMCNALRFPMNSAHGSFGENFLSERLCSYPSSCYQISSSRVTTNIKSGYADLLNLYFLSSVFSSNFHAFLLGWSLAFVSYRILNKVAGLIYQEARGSESLAWNPYDTRAKSSLSWCTAQFL